MTVVRPDLLRMIHDMEAYLSPMKVNHPEVILRSRCRTPHASTSRFFRSQLMLHSIATEHLDSSRSLGAKRRELERKIDLKLATTEAFNSYF